MLASKGEELVALGALRNLDAVLVGPFLDLAVAPRVEEFVSQRLLGAGGRGGKSRRSRGSLVGSETGVAADSSDQLVAGASLGDWYTTLIQPSLEVRVRPGLVKPVTRVGSSLANLVGSRLVVGAGGTKKRVAGARRWVRNVVVVKERLELGLGPAVSLSACMTLKMLSGCDEPVKDPVLNARVRVRGLVGSLVPVALDLGDETVLVLLGALLGLLALGGKVR